MFDAFVAFRARLDPNAPAVMTPERIVSYADLDADVQRLAGGLHALGLTRASGFVAKGRGLQDILQALHEVTATA